MRNNTRLGAATAMAAMLAVFTLAGCGSSGSSAPTVPSLSGRGSGGAAGDGQGTSRSTALRTAADCIRRHGIPSYADPVLTPSGSVYSDTRSFANAGQSAIDAVAHACATLMAQANLNPQAEPPAPPQLVQAGVRNAECFRAHGLPSIQDPNAQTPYVPGHGFSLTVSQIPAGGKTSPAFQGAIQACRAADTAELQASTLASLGHDG